MQNPTELITSLPPASFRNMESLPVKEMTLQDLWGLLSRRKSVMSGVFLGVFAIAVLLFATTQRLYKASAEIQVQKGTADALSLDTMMGPSDTADAVESNINLQTEAQILQSESLAESVIKGLDLENSPDFKGHFNPISWMLSLFAPPGIADPKNVDLEDAPGRRAHAVTAFAAHLKIKPISGTRLITIEYYSSNSRTAAAVVNLLVQNLVDYNFATRHNATQQASSWLTAQLSDLRKHSEDLQAKVVDMQHGSGVFTMGQTDSQGHEQVYTPVLDRLQQATSQLAQAQSARIMKGALYQVVKDGDPELISGLAGNSTLSGASSGVSSSLTLLQNLREHETEKQAELSELSSKFGPAYPKLSEIQATLQATQAAIRAESGRIASRVKNDYIVAQQVESNDRAAFEREKTQAEAVNDKAVGYEIVRQEASQSRNLYETLLSRLKEADLVAGLHSSNITVVDRAHVPARPAKPNIVIYAGGGIVGGLVLGVCAALFRDATDSRIQDLAELNAFGQGPIAFLPHHSMAHARRRLVKPKRAEPLSLLTDPVTFPPDGLKCEAMIAAMEPRAAYTEALRSLRTSLMQSGYGELPPQALLVTSSIPGEGKSMLSINLAIVYAQRGKKVLLVDGDLRTPTLHTRLGLLRDHGLTEMLSSGDDRYSFRPIRVPLGAALEMSVIPAGPPASYPTELLASDEMADLMQKWRSEYDHIIIDGAPLLPITDSAVLGRYADFTIIVARHNMTDRRSLERTCQILQAQGVRHTGVVLNGVRADGGAQHRYYGYNPSAYQESEV